MIIDKYSDSSIIIREKYGWKKYCINNIKLWFCGYLYDHNVEDFLEKIDEVINNKCKNNVILNLVNNLNGHFAFVIEYNSLVIASVDKICSIPLFFCSKDDGILISNYAPFLKEKCELGSDDLDSGAELEIAMSGHTIGNKTLYNSIKRLESGECLIFNQGLLYIESYYHYSPWKAFVRDKSQLHREFTDICLNIFKQIRDSAGDRQIVVPLSAGNDSRLIASGLKEVGAKNVVCFSYGRKGNFETPISKSIASKLGFKWVYIQDRLKDKRCFFQSEIYYKYIDAFESFSYTHNVQEVYEVFLLQKNKLVDDDAIIINGNSGDFISGGHIRSISEIHSTPHTIDEIDWNKFLDKHYSLWDDLRGPGNDEYIVSKLKKTLPKYIKKSVCFEKYHYAMMEYIECIGRQSKIVIGQQRTYEYFGYEWRLPFWSDEMLNFWESIPYEYKIDQCLYLEILRKNNWVMFG